MVASIAAALGAPAAVTQCIIGPGKDTNRTIRAANAGLTKFMPIPPNICLTTTIAIRQPNMAISGLISTGKFNASKRPVTTADKSPMVASRFMILRERNSSRTQVAIQIAISTMERMPKITHAMIDAGISAMITSSMIRRVVLLPLK